MPVTHVPVTISDAATYTVLAQNSGLTHFIPDLTADIVITLPTPVAGLNFEFIYAGAAADAQDWLIDTGSDTNYYVGGVTHSDLDGDTQAPVYSDGNSNSKFVVLVPEVGTWVKIWCSDGTTWHINGNVSSATVCTMGDQ